MNEEVNRIVILEKNIKGDLSKCEICDINFTAIQPCMMCQLIIEKEEELGRKLTKEKIREIYQEVLVKPTIEDTCTCGCGKIIEEHPDIRYRIGGKQVTSDCYFRVLGEHIDNNSINTPREYD